MEDRGNRRLHRDLHTSERNWTAVDRWRSSLGSLVVLREKAIRPLLAAAQDIRPSRGSQNPTTLDRHYETIRVAMAGVLRELRVAA